jgi:hypothetical protein
MKPRELVKLAGTIVIMAATLAISAARTGIDAADSPGSAEVSYEVSPHCADA